MARKRSSTLTPAEQRVMEAVWTLKECSVGDVLAIITQDTPAAYTTVMTVLKVLEQKGYLTVNRSARALIYKAKVSKEKAQAQALKVLVKQFFGGSSTALAQQLLRREDIDREELESLDKMIRAALAKRKGDA